MQIGMVGLGRMGANMAERLLKGGHEVVGFDLGSQAVEELASKGGVGASSLEELAGKLSPKRAVWVMVPAGPPVDATLETLSTVLEAGDVIIDGGNSFYKDTMRRGAALEQRGIQLVDVGTSGGVWGLAEGYSMMAGGDEGAVEHLEPALRTLAPGADIGWGRVGPRGAGHFVKMVHNGIEYGMMQAYAEGFSLFESKTEFELDVAQIAGIWSRGSVVRSWLLELTERALKEDAGLSKLAPWVDDSGEGRWTAIEAIELGVPAPVISTSLFERFSSRDRGAFAHKLLAAMRHQFGGHAVREERAE